VKWAVAAFIMEMKMALVACFGIEHRVFDLYVQYCTPLSFHFCILKSS